jgi:Domain of unknown function (DUF5127)/Domain of unknown function (DUF4965)/Domain of unknown function (DUF1793)/Domain of unknown function (DUF4964)
MAGGAFLAAPAFSLLRGLTGNVAVAKAGTVTDASTPTTTPDGFTPDVSGFTVTLGGADVRPPSIPLAVRSPYLTTWLPATSLTAATPQFWNGASRTFVGLALIDGQPYAWAGAPVLSSGATVTPMTAVATDVTATRSTFTASAGGVELVAEWLSPVEPGNLALQSSPLTLLTVSVNFTDGNSHDVQVYADITGEWASSNENELISWETTADTTARYWTVSLQAPNPLTENNQMANWGSIVWAAPRSPSLTFQSGYSVSVRSQFAATGNLLDASDQDPRAINDQQPAFAFAVDFGSSPGSTSFTIGHVRTPLINYGQTGTQLLPLWSQYWSDWQEMTAAFIAGAGSARSRAIALDSEVEQQALSAFNAISPTGPNSQYASGYSAACALALRQCYGGTELAIGTDGTPWLLGKEISSDGDTNTVDIFDQAFLAWLWMDPDLIPLVMAPILNWCASPAWQSSPAWNSSSPPYCVHDLGIYPNATGRVPGNGEQMPIEESAGMLIMAAAYANAVGASTAAPFLNQWTELWTQWAEYLATQVPTPSTQLTTDDWAGIYASTSAGVNLGIKAIIGLAAAGKIAAITGNTANAATWSNLAATSVTEWVDLSTDTSGTHLNVEQRATVGSSANGTWTSLYNAYYELVIGLDSPLVPQSVANNEASYYLTQLTAYGMPLQSAAGGVNKVAWQFYLPAWLKNHTIVDDLMSRNVDYINDTPSLVPYGDRYDTTTGVEVAGIQAHPTLGAVFAILAAQGTAPGAPTQPFSTQALRSAAETPASATPAAHTASVQPAKAASTKKPKKKPKKAKKADKRKKPDKRKKKRDKPKEKPKDARNPLRKRIRRKPKKAASGKRPAKRLTRHIGRAIKAISSFSR